MKKTFNFTIEGKNSDRVRDAIRHEIKKYIKRERAKTLPDDAGYWAFGCKFGINEAAAETIQARDIGQAMEQLAATGADSCYVEILASPGAKASVDSEQ